jgi:hypothetical protein
MSLQAAIGQAAGFQQERFYRHSQERWQELARTARLVVVFADFGESSAADVSPVKIRLPADAPFSGQWIMIADYLLLRWSFHAGVPTPGIASYGHHAGCRLEGECRFAGAAVGVGLSRTGRWSERLP